MADIMRQQAVPSDKYGKRPEERTVEELLDFGILVIDKPSGPTSHQVSAYTQDILGIERTGHAGTLDPKVTGVLPVATGRATRLLEYLLKAGKEYVGVMHLHDDVPEYEIRKVAEEFLGTITQLPPKRSSVARRNRQRNIYAFRFLEVRGRDVLFLADVQAGTYIRKLCHDFGERLGVGAHMASLRRVRASHYREDEAITLQTLTDVFSLYKEGGREDLLRKHLLTGEHIVHHLPRIVILDSAVHSLTHGASLKVPGISVVQEGIVAGDSVRVVTLKDELVAVGTARLSSVEMAGDRGIAVKVDKVFLSGDVYPRME